jgi:hypothetical protein
MVPGSEPFVVWPGRFLGAAVTDGLFFQVGDDAVSITNPTPNFIPVSDSVAALRAVYTDSVPGAVWMTDVPGGGIELFAGTAAGQTSALAQCQDDPSFSSYGLHTGLTLENLWTVSWSKRGAAFSSENTVIQCAGDACTDESGLDPGDTCDAMTSGTRVNANFRHLLVEAFPDPNDARSIFQAILLARDQGGTTSILMVVNHVDLGGESTPVGNATIASGAGSAAPDWPEIALIPPDTVAVSWTQPTADGGGDEARFKRYRICP